MIMQSFNYKKIMKKIVLYCLITLTILLSSCNTNEVHTHAFGEWETVKEANCTEDGQRVRTCSCGESETEVITAIGHIYKYTEYKDENENLVNVAICERESCEERRIVTDKERLIGEWRNAAGVYEGDIEITVKGFIHQIALSYWPELVLTISEDNIYFFSQQYLYEVQLVSNYNYSFDYMLLGNSDKIINGEKVSDIIEKIQACETGYLLQTKTGQGPDSGFRIFIVRVENYYYFSLIDNYSNNPVYHIYYTDFSEVSE